VRADEAHHRDVNHFASVRHSSLQEFTCFLWTTLTDLN
jgi:hypothetical protein